MAVRAHLDITFSVLFCLCWAGLSLAYLVFWLNSWSGCFCRLSATSCVVVFAMMGMPYTLSVCCPRQDVPNTLSCMRGASVAAGTQSGATRLDNLRFQCMKLNITTHVQRGLISTRRLRCFWGHAPNTPLQQVKSCCCLKPRRGSALQQMHPDPPISALSMEQTQAALQPAQRNLSSISASTCIQNGARLPHITGIAGTLQPA